MKKHWLYFKYVLRHKYYVGVALFHLWLQHPRYIYLLWAIFTHDLSKFSPLEWFAYVEHFYGPKRESIKLIPGKPTKRQVKNSAEYIQAQFEYAWNHHQKANKHHWQYWLLKNDSGELVPLFMPYKFVLEMVADWRGAGLAIHGVDDTENWYVKNKDKMILNAYTRRHIIELFQENVANLLLSDKP